MAHFITVGQPELRVYDQDLTTLVKTLFLPVPSKKGIALEWVMKGNSVELLDGSNRTRKLGYIPVLTLKWATAYDERSGRGKIIGDDDGNTVGVRDLLRILSLPSGRFAISTGGSEGFVVDRAEVSPVGVIGRAGFADGLQIKFVGRNIQDSMDLQAW